VYVLGDPVGNIDVGGTWGSYLGLIFLGSAFVAIGLFASSISKNQVIAFIVALFLCFLCYAGFDLLSGIDGWGSMELFVQKLGISHHYKSLSKGAVDTRDLLYFTSLIAFFILLTKLRLGARKN